MNKFKALLVVLFIIGILFLIYLIATQDLTGRESSLMTIILTICSVLATWLVAHLYSESQLKKAIQEVQELHSTNLQTYAKKAAEKVNNLSNELGRLSIYLSEELDRSELDNPKEALLTREERITSAIHIVNMLKSVNDTALSDWEGVIGDLLDQQREEKEEKEEELIDLLDRVENVAVERFDERYGDHYDRMQIREEIESLRKDLRYVARNLAVTQVPIRRNVRKQKHDVNISCLKCGEEVNYRQRPTTKGYKGIVCKACDTKFVSRYSKDEGFSIEERQLRVETINCPECEGKLQVELDNLPCSTNQITCEKCNEQIRVSRSIEGTISIKQKSKKVESQIPQPQISEETIEKVKQKLPPQPWPTGIHKSVADELSLPHNTVSRVIDQLIRRGIFKPQIYGQLFVPASSPIEVSEIRQDQKSIRKEGNEKEQKNPHKKEGYC